LLLASLLTAGVTANAEPVPVADFAKSNQFSNPHLSPDGKHLAVTVREKDGDDDVWRLAIYRVADMQIASLMKMPKYELPANYMWADDMRLVIAKGKVTGSLDVPQLTGEIIATDVDGKNQAYVFGSEHADSLRVRAKGQDEAFGLLDGVPNPRNGHFYLRAYPWGNDKRSMLYEMEPRKAVRAS
jgi:dipeptidyl aminopeptidase/acylaminoacyl peptidase